MPIQDEAERQVAERTNAIAEALTETDAEVSYDEDGDEGWHITIGAGHEHYRAEGGTDRESVLAYWTRDDTWYWETLGSGSEHTGPWPLRVGTPEYLDGTSDVASIVERVLANVTCDDPECESDRVEPSYPIFTTYGQKQEFLSRIPEVPSDTRPSLSDGGEQRG